MPSSPRPAGSVHEEFERRERTGEMRGMESGRTIGYAEATAALSGMMTDVAQVASRVAWQLAHGPIPAGDFRGTTLVLHHCDNPACVRPDHLHLGDHPLNMGEMAARGRSARGEAVGVGKLAEAQVVEIRGRYCSGSVTQRQLAAEFGVSCATISQILQGKTWAHLGGPFFSATRQRPVNA